MRLEPLHVVLGNINSIHSQKGGEEDKINTSHYTRRGRKLMYQNITHTAQCTHRPIYI
jgi:hypothetical protein